VLPQNLRPHPSPPEPAISPDTITSASQSERILSTGKEFVINLPPEMADFVRRRVASGEYADESAVIVDSVALLQDQQKKMERWLREDVMPACAAFEAEPAPGISAAELLAHLDVARRDRQRSS
jgi:antitoxin ParD1/3/4